MDKIRGSWRGEERQDGEFLVRRTLNRKGQGERKREGERERREGEGWRDVRVRVRGREMRGRDGDGTIKKRVEGDETGAGEVVR